MQSRRRPCSSTRDQNLSKTTVAPVAVADAMPAPVSRCGQQRQELRSTINAHFTLESNLRHWLMLRVADCQSPHFESTTSGWWSLAAEPVRTTARYSLVFRCSKIVAELISWTKYSGNYHRHHTHLLCGLSDGGCCRFCKRAPFHRRRKTVRITLAKLRMSPIALSADAVSWYV